jgi:hypothetical protein
MLEIEVSSGHEAIIAPCLQLRFEWREDHWKHEMVSTGLSAAIPRVWSLDGGFERDSTRVGGPVYQQLHVRPDPSGVVRALLVGQSGPHHFSAAFTIEETTDGVVVDVDVADRCRSPVEALGATYLIEASEGEMAHSAGSATLSWHHPESRLVFEAEPPARIVAEEASFGTIRLQALAAIDPSEQTHRFRYRWRWSNSPGRQLWDYTA